MYQRYAIALMATLLAGCGTMHHFIPPAPIEPGKTAGSIGLSWSSSRFVAPALEANFYLGLGGRNLLGIGFNNFIFPTTLTCVHYEPAGDRSYANVQLHGSLVGTDPRYELDLGYSVQRGDASHAFKLGLGYMRNLQPGLGSFQRSDCFGLIPVAGYDFRYGRLALAALLQPGMTRHVIGALASGIMQGRDSEVVVVRDSVLSIERTGWGEGGGWEIRLRDSSSIYVTPHDGYFHEWLSPSHLQELNRYTASPSHRYLRVVHDRTRPGLSPLHIQGPGFIGQLDMDAILGRYATTGVLTIREEPGTLERTLEAVSPMLDDISLGIGVEITAP
jgi:hypothetical protein